MTFSWIQLIAFMFFGLGLILSLWRLILGPTVIDRIIAADTLSVMVTAALVWLSSLLDNGIYLTVALVYGALTFIGTVALARSIDAKYSDKEIESICPK